MEIKVKILLALCVLMIKSNVAYNSTSFNLLREIEENQGLGMDCSLYSNSIESFIIEYKQMSNSLSMMCQLHLKSTTKKLMVIVDSILKQKLDQYLINVEKMKSQIIEFKQSSYPEDKNVHQSINCRFNSIMDNSKSQIDKKNNIIYETLVSIIRNGDASVGYELFSKANGEINLKTLLLNVYDNKIITAEKIIDFLNLFAEFEDIIYGYRIIFEQMSKKEQIYSTPTTRIAYRVFVEYKQKFVNNENLIYLQTNLPDSLKNFPWNQLVCQRNVKLQETIWYENYPSYHHGDKFRLLTFTHGSKATDSPMHALKFIPVANGKYFLIKSNKFEEYIYADSDEFKFNSEQRAVFGWMRKNEIKETGHWTLEPLLGSPYFKIKNIYWNEYLAIAENVNKIKGRLDLHQLFTRSGLCDDELCKWEIVKYTGV